MFVCISVCGCVHTFVLICRNVRALLVQYVAHTHTHTQDQVWCRAQLHRDAIKERILSPASRGLAGNQHHDCKPPSLCFYKHLRYVLNMPVKLRSIHILQDSSRMQYIAEEGCADSSLQAKWGSVQQEVSFAKALGVLPLGHRASNCLGNRLSGGNMGSGGRACKGRGRRVIANNRGRVSRWQARGRGRRRWSTAMTSEQKMLKIATTGQIEACLAD